MLSAREDHYAFSFVMVATGVGAEGGATCQRGKVAGGTAMSAYELPAVVASGAVGSDAHCYCSGSGSGSELPCP